MTKPITNWGNYPVIQATEETFQTTSQLKESLHKYDTVIARGLGRCYGDAALNDHIISSLNYNKFLSFDAVNGVIDCQAGVSLSDVLNVVVPKGWFLPVTPGTRFITV